MSLSSIYQLKVTLQDISPPIWRRLIVDADTTLAHLHKVLQAAFGWENCHLHVFSAHDVRYGTPSQDDWEPVRDERRTKIGEVLRKPKEGMVYEYDFGDSWEHQIIFEKVLATSEHSMPACSAGKRACPPEDCGGPWGYANFLDAISDANHPEHAEYLEWIGGEFDPEKFSLDAVNAALGRLRRKK